VRGDHTEWPLEIPGDWRQYTTATRETRYGEKVQNSHWRDQLREETTKCPLERPGEGRQYIMATGETR